MSEQIQKHDFSEQDAVTYIKSRLKDDLRQRLSDEQILHIITKSYDFFEANGLLDMSDLDAEVDENALGDFLLKKCNYGLTREDLLLVIHLEEEYEDTIDII